MGDFDGAAAICEASRFNSVYWLSNEDRYDEISSHSWARGYIFSDFRGHYYPIQEESDVIHQSRQILRDLGRRADPRKNRQRHLTRMYE